MCGQSYKFESPTRLLQEEEATEEAGTGGEGDTADAAVEADAANETAVVVSGYSMTVYM